MSLQSCSGHSGALGWHLLPLQKLLLLLPIGVNQLLRDQLHQLQALLYLHQDLEVLPASHLEEGTSPALTVALFFYLQTHPS